MRSNPCRPFRLRTNCRSHASAERELTVSGMARQRMGLKRCKRLGENPGLGDKSTESSNSLHKCAMAEVLRRALRPGKRCESRTRLGLIARREVAAVFHRIGMTRITTTTTRRHRTRRFCRLRGVCGHSARSVMVASSLSRTTWMIAAKNTKITTIALATTPTTSTRVWQRWVSRRHAGVVMGLLYMTPKTTVTVYHVQERNAGTKAKEGAYPCR